MAVRWVVALGLVAAVACRETQWTSVVILQPPCGAGADCSRPITSRETRPGRCADQRAPTGLEVVGCTQSSEEHLDDGRTAATVLILLGLAALSFETYRLFELRGTTTH